MMYCVRQNSYRRRHPSLGVVGLVSVVGVLVFGLVWVVRVHTFHKASAGSVYTPAFDVVSIRPNNAISGSPHLYSNVHGIRGRYVRLENLINWAYGPARVGDHPIVGAPKWTDSARYDIEAKLDDSTVDALQKLGVDQFEHTMRLMLQTFLMERFHLAIHKQQIELPVYELVLAKGGSKVASARAEDPERPDGTIIMTPGQIAAESVSMEHFAMILGSPLQRPVVDRTGLTGRYDFALEWRPDKDSSSLSGEQSYLRAPAAQSEITRNPALFTAIQEQLGLMLKPAKGPGEALIVDHVQRPSPN